MKISYNWLKQYVDFDENPQELSVILTDSGLEVEGVAHFESVKGGLQGVVIGQVVSCNKHPQADRLSVTEVDTGEGELLPIVCGAPNVAAGQKVLVAKTGTTLHTAQGPLEIKKAKIRGQESRGMICAEDELGLGSNHEGIIVLAEDAPIGMPAARYLDVKEDWVLEIGLTPNRIDAASHLGVARDIVAVINHRTGKKDLVLKQPPSGHLVIDNHDLPIPVVIEDPEACPRYCGITLSGITVGPSPEWLQTFLRAIGLKPINNVVDITNFVLHELGQPLHAFDADAIEGNKVIVGKPAKGTPFVTLDDEEVKLTGDDLMINNTRGAMCIAGVLGGKASGVTAGTRNIFLESAYFNPVSIRKTARQHGLSTDASFRFERGANPDMAPVALVRAAMLIRDIAGGTISSELVDEYPRKIIPQVVELNYQRVNRLIGQEIPEQEIKGILQDLDISILKEEPHGLTLSIPLYRVDVTREADVVEEILRIYGYNNIELPSRLFSSIVLSPKPDKEAIQNQVADMLSARGFIQIMNNSLTKASYFESFGFDPQASVNILNPLSQDLNAMRQSLLFGALETIAHNRNRRITDMRLYEFGNIYRRDQSGNRNNVLPGYAEKMMLGMYVTGNRQPETWNTTQQPVSFFDLKEAVMALFKRMGLEERRMELSDEATSELFEYQLQYSINNKVLATLGLLANPLMKAFDIRQQVFYAEVEWEALLTLSVSEQLLYQEVSRFPEVRRDLALLIDQEVTFERIRKTALSTGRKLLREVRLFDVYQDERLGANKKSYAVAFTLLDENKTLTDKEIDKFMQKMVFVLEKELGAEIRK
ncbi:MAG: phenylalanine--tRNA ligase subunit beta [Bacteroidales bacterium]